MRGAPKAITVKDLVEVHMHSRGQTTSVALRPLTDDDRACAGLLAGRVVAADASPIRLVAQIAAKTRREAGDRLSEGFAQSVEDLARQARSLARDPRAHAIAFVS